MLLVLALAVHASASYQCGFQSGFERPELQKQAVQKCTMPKQEVFIEIENLESDENDPDYLDARDSCKRFTLDGNPNCVTSDGGSNSKVPQCKIDFGGKTVKIDSVKDDGEWRPNDWPFVSALNGCKKQDTYNALDSQSATGLEDKVLSDYLEFFPVVGYSSPEWSMCFTKTTEALSKCNANYLEVF